MSHRASRILTLFLATASLCLVGTTANAQTAGRYLTWANRPANTTPADVAAAQTRARDMIPRRVAPSQGFNRPVMQAPTTNVAVSRGLTPASAWIGPRVTPAYAPGSPDPVGDATAVISMPAYPTPSPAPPPTPVERAAVDPMAPRRDAPVYNLPRPVQTAPVQPAPVQQTQTAQQAPAPQSTTQAEADPMAPRRDARIFQVQQGQAQGQQQAALPAPAAPQAAPSAQSSVQAGQPGARYYSVHRDAGHRPDPTALPEPVYFDSVTVDLAEPPATEVPVRDAQNRRRVVANADPSLP